ncbi:type II toxin-antitoxin system ParD family antitoxin [Flavobacterium sp. RS13.1]|uniref:type II toxin-antitoxin system ParD family antitoxin n=1 Tax=Flavobacterium sp. RS13.1 TaxID=3400345 RepID=UPI003AAC94A0
MRLRKLLFLILRFWQGSLRLGGSLERFKKNSVNNGRFNNVSEVVRAGLRLLEDEENRIIALRKAINEGIDSGRAVDFDAKKYLEVLKARKKSNG